MNPLMTQDEDLVPYATFFFKFMREYGKICGFLKRGC